MLPFLDHSLTSLTRSGEVSFVKVQARDRFDNNLTTGGDAVTAVLSFQPPSGPAQTFEVSVNVRFFHERISLTILGQQRRNL